MKLRVGKLKCEMSIVRSSRAQKSEYVNYRGRNRDACASFSDFFLMKLSYQLIPATDCVTEQKKVEITFVHLFKW